MSGLYNQTVLAPRSMEESGTYWLFSSPSMSKERELRQPARSDRRRERLPSLRRDVRDILWRAERMTGREIRIVPYPSLEAWASIRVARKGEARHTLRYNPRYGRHLDYLVAHECGHLLRLWSVTPEERFVPAVGRKERMIAYGRLLEELSNPLRLLPEQAVAGLLRTWHDGIVRQVSSFPVDIRIEAWLYEHYPGMREAQVPALVEQLVENQMVLRPEVATSTPESVYRASAAINCAFAQSLALLLREPSLCRAYPHELSRLGGRLLGQISSQEDPSHTGDVATANGWAELLGLSGWFRWTRVDDVPGVDVSTLGP